MNCPKYFTFSFADIIAPEISSTILSFSSLDNNSHLSGLLKFFFEIVIITLKICYNNINDSVI